MDRFSPCDVFTIMSTPSANLIALWLMGVEGNETPRQCDVTVLFRRCVICRVNLKLQIPRTFKVRSSHSRTSAWQPTYAYFKRFRFQIQIWLRGCICGEDPTCDSPGRRLGLLCKVALVDTDGIGPQAEEAVGMAAQVFELSSLPDPARVARERRAY